VKWLRDINIRADILIAVCALVISALATGASWWQSRVVADQLSAEVWPYVSMISHRSKDEVQFSLSNDGLGPAIIESFVIAVDGKPQRNVVDAVVAAVGRPHHPKGSSLDYAATDVTRGRVLRVGASLDVVDIKNAEYGAAFLALNDRRLDIRICYCSIDGECFFKENSEESPRRVAGCPPVAGQLGEPPTNARL
jgi:hypothetical protein